MRALGLDLGCKTLGIAITDELKIVSSSLENFVYPTGQLDFCVDKLKKILEQYKDIDVVVLGYPSYPSGQMCENSYYVLEFKKMIQEFLNAQQIKLVLQDEQYSTKKATSELKKFGIKASKIKKIKDKTAACVILDEWILWNDI